MDELKVIEDIARGPGFGFSNDQDVFGFNDNDLVGLGFDGVAKSAKSPTGTSYGFTIVNVNMITPKVVKLFGFEGRNYTDGDITITAQGGYGSYHKFCEYVYANPLEVVSLRITTTASQVDQMSLSWYKQDVFGKSDSDVLSLSAFRTEQDYQTGIITVPFRFLLCYDAHIEFTILASTTVDMLIFIGVRRELSKAVEQKASPPAIVTKIGKKPIAVKRPGAGA